MLIKNGAKIKITLPSIPTPRESFAASELLKYLTLCLDVTEVTDGADVSFVIGGPSRNTDTAAIIGTEEFSKLLTGAEGMLINICERSVLIAGSEGFDDMERGTVYAVYEFLERYLGCSLTAYSHPDADAGEIVPKLEEIKLENGRYVKPCADRPYRAAIVQYGNKAGNPEHNLNIPFFDWLVKNRYNRVVTWCKIYEGYKQMGLISELERRGIALTVGHHDAIDYWLPFFGNVNASERYFETHPEYYRLNVDGTRFKPQAADDATGQWVLCSRNEECIAAISQNIIKWISENPYVDVIALWPRDGRAEQCMCEKCAPYSKVQNYVYFLCEAAKRVRREHPHVKFDILLYTNLWTYPEGAEIPDNVFFNMSTWADAGLRHCGKPDGSCLVGTHFTDTLLEWKSQGSDVVFYDYYMGVFGARQRIIPMADEISSICRYFAENGICGTGTQLECFHIWNHLVNVCAFGRIAYDASLTLDNVLGTVCKLFGNGARYVKEIINYLEEKNDGEVSLDKAGFFLMENIDKPYVYGLYEKALADAETARARNNVRLMRMAFRYSDIETADPGSRQPFAWVLPYEDPTGEIAYMATRFDSFYYSKTGFAIAFPVANTDVKGFAPDKWYLFE